jgi:hypothetical protein
MTEHILSLVLDIAVLIGLGFTIFYCLKLSRSMNNFRQHRQEMNKLIDNLSRNIDEALRAIDGLKIAGDRSGRDLQKIINESRSMAEELQMINETSNSLASRLENLAGQGNFSAQSFEEPEEYVDEPVETHAPRNVAMQRPAFYIQDRDYNDDAPVNDDEDEGGMSKAEKELAEALRKNKNPGRGVF